MEVDAPVVRVGHVARGGAGAVVGIEERLVRCIRVHVPRELDPGTLPPSIFREESSVVSSLRAAHCFLTFLAAGAAKPTSLQELCRNPGVA